MTDVVGYGGSAIAIGARAEYNGRKDIMPREYIVRPSPSGKTWQLVRVSDGRVFTSLKSRPRQESQAAWLNAQLDMIAEGLLDGDNVILACVGYMSEAEVADVEASCASF